MRERERRERGERKKLKKEERVETREERDRQTSPNIIRCERKLNFDLFSLRSSMSARY